MKTICPSGYHHSGFLATHILTHDVRFIYIIILHKTVLYQTDCMKLYQSKILYHTTLSLFVENTNFQTIGRSFYK